MNNKNLRKFTACILFADLIDSMKLASRYPPEEYDTLINDFQKHFWETIMDLNMYAYFRNLNSAEMNARGDEASIFMPFDENKKDISNFLCLAMDFKTSWLISEHNIHRLSQNKKVVDIAIGINVGPVTSRTRYGWDNEEGLIENARIGMEGFTISIAKRLEGLARGGKYSSIMVSQVVVDNIRRNQAPYQFHSHGEKEIKGLYYKIPVYELKTCWNWIIFSRGPGPRKFCENIEKLIETDPSNVWLKLILADAFGLLCLYDRSSEIAKEILEKDPDNAQAYYLLAEAEASKRNYREAANLLLKSIEYGGKGFMKAASSNLAYDGQKRFFEFDKINSFIKNL